jgi:hypothetical protein
MRPVKLFLPLLCLFAAMVGSLPTTSYGYHLSWSTESDNGQYVFVYLSANSLPGQIALIKEWEEDPPHSTHASEIAEVERLHRTYTVTGMYSNNGSTTPLWTTKEPDLWGKPTPDGRHLFGLYSDDGIFSITVLEPSYPWRRIDTFEIIGWPAVFLYVASGEYAPYADSYVLDPASQHVLVTWDNQTTTTIRLDDFAIVQSNVLPHAFFQLFTTMQGITVFLVFVLIACGVAYGIARCFMGGSAKEARR